MKKLLIVSSLLLSSCVNTSIKTCILTEYPFKITAYIEHKSQRIKAYKVATEIDLDVFNNDEVLIEKYLKDYENYHLDEDKLIIYEDYKFNLDNNEYYHLDKTIEELLKSGYICS